MSIPDYKISPNFWYSETVRSETADRLGIDNTPSPEILASLTNGAHHMELIRERCGGKVVHVSSWYRCPDLNKAAGGSLNSAHMDGRATDFTIPAFGAPMDVCRAIVESDIPFDQLIHEFGRWTHAGWAKGGIAPRRQVLTIDRFGTRIGLHEIRKQPS